MMRFLFALIVALCSAQSAFAAVAVDATSTSTGSGGSTLSWSHTVSGSNTLLICSAHISSGSAVSTFRFNSVDLTLKSSHPSSASTYFVEMWYLIAPASGTHTVALTLSGGADNTVAGCTSFTGADQASPIGTASFNGVNDDVEDFPPTITVPSGGIAYDVVFFGNSSGACASSTPGGSQTKRFDDCVGSAGFNATGASSTRGTSGTMNWLNLSGALGSQIAVPISAPSATSIVRRKPVIFQ